jgi:hypothetical protein
MMKPRCGLDRAAQWIARRSDARLDLQLLQQIVKGQARHDAPKPNAERAFLVMHAHRDHRFLEAGIADARHCEEELSAQELGLVHVPAYRLAPDALLERAATKSLCERNRR